MGAQTPIVLVVDDNEAKRYTITRYLKAAGFEVWETDSGYEAIQLAKNQPSVIALDVNLPDILGYEVSRRLREDPRTASIPIVQISATFTGAINRAQGLNSGADTYLSGAVDPEELVATVNAMIRMRKAESTARDLAAQWQSTFDAISDAVLLVSSEGLIERCNQAFCLLANTPPETIIGRGLSETSGAAPLDQDVFFAMAQTRRRESTERQAGSEWFSTTADPVLNSTGEFTGGVIIISNITVRKRLEEAQEREQRLLHQETERLEAKVLERTRQLQDSVSTMEGFCYTIAHDLRAPLRAVNGFTATLLEHYSPSFDEDGKALAGRITAATKRMDQLIQELLAFGRLSSTELPRWTVDLSGTVRAAVAQCSADIKEKQAAVEIIEPLPNVWANATIVEQIFVNLLTNALKFVPPHVTPKVAVRADQQGERVRIWVEDNGIGIDPAYHNKIFGLFERLHSDSHYRGTGVGLAIVRKAAQRMGGRAGVESVPGRGSRFWVELPAPRVKHGSNHPQPEAPP